VSRLPVLSVPEILAYLSIVAYIALIVRVVNGKGVLSSWHPSPPQPSFSQGARRGGSSDEACVFEDGCVVLYVHVGVVDPPGDADGQIRASVAMKVTILW
jgi:hypothetical protein